MTLFLTLGTRLTLIYTVLAIVIMYGMIVLLPTTSRYSFPLFVVSLLCIFLLHTPPKLSHGYKIVYTHVVWLLFIFCISSSLQPIYNMNSNLFKTAFLTTTILTGLIVVASTFVTRNVLGWGWYLFWALLSLIIFRLFDTSTVGKNRVYGKITIVLFTLFIIYDVQYLNKYANSDIASLPRQSLGIFLDFVNMLTGVFSNK